MKHLIYISIISFFAFFIISFLSIDNVSARPGGGHSYKKSKSKSRSSSRSSSGSSSRSSSYSKKKSSSYSSSNEGSPSGDYDYSDYDYEFSRAESSENSALWSGLIFLAVFGSVGGIVKFNEAREEKRNLVSKPTVENKQEKYKKNINNFNKLIKADPSFSQVLFLDFASSVFIKYKSWLGKKEFINLTPFVLPGDIEYAQAFPESISEIVIGSINLSKISINNQTQNIVVEIDANYTSKDETDDWSMRFAVVEKWQFSRKVGTLSPEPEKMRELSCPVCGANTGFTSAGNCESCGTKIENGEKQWYLSSHKLMNSESFDTKGLAYYAPEAGTELPTIYQATLDRNTKKFADKHNIEWDEWKNKFENSLVNDYFTKLYAAWSVKKLDNVRNLLSDRLYESWMFWIDNYTKEGLTNKLNSVKIEKTEFVKMEIDKFYESATIRISASCKDFVINKSGKLVGGSKSKNRKFSEYWTFVRRTGVERDSYDYNTCPNCGAPSDKMGQTGTCEYCNTKISNGDFSWVLATITQDEVYKG